MKTAACIILYHPDTDRLRENILAIAKDLDLLILWRNSPEEIPIPEVDVPVVRLGTGENRYIAAPLNECFRYCADRGIDWLLTMDQDSVWEDFEGFVQTAEKYLQKGIIAFAPSVNRNLSATEECIDIDYTITSGSLCHVPSVLAAGGFRESYQIYWVDGEFCHRARKAGYRILALPRYNLNQHFGELDKGKGFNYSPTTYYFMFRNMLWMRRDHKTNPSVKTILYSSQMYLRSILFHEKNKMKKLAAVCRGTFDGCFKSTHTA
jgi:rhamnosyltransferase